MTLNLHRSCVGEATYSYCLPNTSFDGEEINEINQRNVHISRDDEKLVKMTMQRLQFCKKKTATTRKGLKKFKVLKKKYRNLIQNSSLVFEVSDDSSLGSEVSNDSSLGSEVSNEDSSLESKICEPSGAEKMPTPSSFLCITGVEADDDRLEFTFQPGAPDASRSLTLPFMSPEQEANLPRTLPDSRYTTYKEELFSCTPPDSTLPRKTKLFQEKFFPDIVS